MNISENLHTLAAFIENAYLCDNFDFSNIENLSDAKAAKDELQSFVNSVHFLNEMNKLFNRFEREFQIAEIERKVNETV